MFPINDKENVPNFEAIEQMVFWRKSRKTATGSRSLPHPPVTGRSIDPFKYLKRSVGEGVLGHRSGLYSSQVSDGHLGAQVRASQSYSSLLPSTCRGPGRALYGIYSRHLYRTIIWPYGPGGAAGGTELQFCSHIQSLYALCSC